MINRINKVFCYWRNNGTRALGRIIFLKLAPKKIRQVGGGEHKWSVEQISDVNVSDLLNTRFESTMPLRTYSLPISQHTSRVNIVTDSIGSGSLFGGVGTSLIFSALLANKLGAQLRIITRTERALPSNLYSILSLYDIVLEKEVQFEFAAFYDRNYEIGTIDGDLFVTTSWWTTAATMPSVPHKSIIYLLQEDERMFYPFGDERYRCEEILQNTNIRFLVNTKLLFDHLVANGLDNISSQGMWFEPAFPSQVFRPRKKDRNAKSKFFFYARPNNPRNLFYLGVEVIEQAIVQGVLNLDDWDIYFVGKDFPEIIFSGNYSPIRCENFAWEEYAGLIGTVDLGMSLMYTPHPSYPPLDLVASGAVVVTNRFANKFDLNAYSKNLICADLNLDALIEALKQAINIARDPNKREQNYSNNKLLTDWNESFEQAIQNFVGHD